MYIIIVYVVFFVQFTMYEQEENQQINKKGQVCSSDVFFIEQTIGNACGTIGMLHALGNCRDQLTFGRYVCVCVCT